MWDAYSLGRSVLTEGGGRLMYKSKKAAGGYRNQTDQVKAWGCWAAEKTVRDGGFFGSKLEKELFRKNKNELC